MNRSSDPLSIFSPLFQNANALELLGFAVLAFYILYSLILLYHWLRYGINKVTVLGMMLFYFGVSLPLAGVIFSYVAL